jgi:hypothetical protein
MRACAQTKPVIMRTHTHGYISVGGRSLCVAGYSICGFGQAWSFPPPGIWQENPPFLQKERYKKGSLFQPRAAC